MNGTMYGNQSWKLLLKSRDTSGAPMRGAVVHDPEDPASCVIRRLAHDLRDQSFEWGDAVLALTSAKHFGVMDIKGGEVRPRSTALVFMLNAHGRTGQARQGGLSARACLDAGLLVCGHHELIVAQRPPIPASFVQIEDASRFEREPGITGKDPAAMLPGSDRILVKPAPHSTVADGGDQSRLSGVASQICDAEARQRQVVGCRQFTRQSLDLDDHVWGKKPGVGRGEPDLPTPPDAPRRSVFATGSRFLAE